MLHSSGSLLLDLDGIVVEAVQRVDDGSRVMRLGTAPRWAGVCPQCEQKSTRSKGWITTRPVMRRSVGTVPPSSGQSGSGCAPTYHAIGKCSPSRCRAYSSQRGRGTAARVGLERSRYCPFR